MQEEVAYAAVASPSGDVLIEHALRSGNAGEIAARILRRLPARTAGAGSGRRSYSMGGEGFTFRLAWGPSGFIFVCMERGMHEQAVWQLLGRVKQRFEAQYGAACSSVSMQPAAPFAEVLAELAAGVNSGVDGGGAARCGSAADQELGSVHQKLEHVKTVMSDSIEKVLERGERIELLVDRAERLEANAITFAKGSTQLRRTLRWRSQRSYIAAAVACCTGLLVLVVSACGGPLLTECRAEDVLAASTATATTDGFSKVV